MDYFCICTFGCVYVCIYIYTHIYILKLKYKSFNGLNNVLVVNSSSVSRSVVSDSLQSHGL